MTKMISLREHLSVKTGFPVDDIDNLIYVLLQVIIENLRQKVEVIDLYPLVRFSRYKRLPVRVNDLAEYISALQDYRKCTRLKKIPSTETVDRVLGDKYLTQFYVPVKKEEVEKLQIKINKKRKKAKLKDIELEQPRAIIYV